MASKASWLTNAVQMGSILVCSCAMVMLWKLAHHQLTTKEQHTTGGNMGRVCTRV